MNELQRRVLIEAEFLFYLATSPALIASPQGQNVDHEWVSSIPTQELKRVNAEARARLRGGSLAARPLPPIKVEASKPAVKPEMVQE